MSKNGYLSSVSFHADKEKKLLLLHHNRSACNRAEQLMNGINPRLTCEYNDVFYVPWSRDSNFDNTDDKAHEQNDFVLLLAIRHVVAVQTKISDFTASVKPSQRKEESSCNIQDESKRDINLNPEANEGVLSTTGSSNLISENKDLPKFPLKRKDIEASTVESSLKRSKRGDPICNKEDVNVKDIGLYYQKSATLTDAELYDLLKNH